MFDDKQFQIKNVQTIQLTCNYCNNIYKSLKINGLLQMGIYLFDYSAYLNCRCKNSDLLFTIDYDNYTKTLYNIPLLDLSFNIKV